MKKYILYLIIINLYAIKKESTLFILSNSKKILFPIVAISGISLFGLYKIVHNREDLLNYFGTKRRTALKYTLFPIVVSLLTGTTIIPLLYLNTKYNNFPKEFLEKRNFDRHRLIVNICNQLNKFDMQEVTSIQALLSKYFTELELNDIDARFPIPISNVVTDTKEFKVRLCYRYAYIYFLLSPLSKDTKLTYSDREDNEKSKIENAIEQNIIEDYALGILKFIDDLA